MLIALATYKFLTTGQLLVLGIMSERANLNKQISELRLWRNPLIGSVTFGVHPTFWKLESVHYLTQHGVNLISERMDADAVIRHPKTGTVLFGQDYFHRISTIDVHIAMKEQSAWKGFELLFFLTYFDQVTSGKKNGYRAESSIKISENEYLIADGIAMLQTPKRKELYAIEVFNGNNTNRVHLSLLQHLKALSVGQPSKQFKLNYGSRVLCVFETESNMRSVMKRLNEDERFKKSKPYFLFNTLEEMKTNIFDGWLLFGGEKVNLF